VAIRVSYAAHKQTPTPRAPVAVNVGRSFLDLVTGAAQLTNMAITYREAVTSVTPAKAILYFL